MLNISSQRSAIISKENTDNADHADMHRFYVKIIEWSNEDSCFIGSCPELFYGGCHGDNEHDVFDELCQIIEETITIYKKDRKTLPRPLSGKEFINAMQKVA